MKRLIRYIFVLAFAAAFFSGCKKSPEFSIKIQEDKNFGSVVLPVTHEKFMESGFEVGDSVDVSFSNGLSFTDIPFVSGYYVKYGNPVLVCYPHTDHVEFAFNSDPVWNKLDFSEKDTAFVKLNTRGKFIQLEKNMSLKYSNDRSDYKSDVTFSNFRSLSGGRIKNGIFFRSASPCDNQNKRAALTDRFCEAEKISFVLNLSDSVEKYEKHKAKDDFDSPYYDSLVKKNCVAFIKLDAAYRSENYQKKLGKGLASLLESRGPYLVHCVEGKDRTGVVCFLMEALCGATYDQMLCDYMITFENYFGITKDGKPDNYRNVKTLLFDEIAGYVASCADGKWPEDLRNADFYAGAVAYLKMCGLSESQVEQLKERISE